MTSPPDPGNINGLTILDANGDQYFLYGDTRIKITEHFSISGKSYSDFVVDMICNVSNLSMIAQADEKDL